VHEQENTENKLAKLLSDFRSQRLGDRLITLEWPWQFTTV